MEQKTLIELIHVYGGSFFFVMGVIVVLLLFVLFVKGWSSHGW
ncbi:hypothetical protein [Clostridium gasigenes]|nr:hypothetical protein [Clostridium gasigenes]